MNPSDDFAERVLRLVVSKARKGRPRKLRRPLTGKVLPDLSSPPKTEKQDKPEKP